MNRLDLTLGIPGARRDTAALALPSATWSMTWPILRVVLCLAVVVGFLALDAATGFARLATSLGDTDDATRLVQVRRFLAGAGWYDLALPRFGGATPLVSHWSRLIDVPLAALMLLFGSVLSSGPAELAARILWPVLLLFVLLLLVAREAERRGGVVAAVLAVLLTATTVSAVPHFTPGRIDHHNVMILGTLAGLFAFARAVTAPSAGWVAGVAFGVALTIGYEPLAFIVPMAGLATLSAVLVPRFQPAVRTTLTALTATLCVGLLVSVSPTQLHVAACDAIGANLVVGVAGAAAALWLVGGPLANRPLAVRLLGAVACGLAGAVSAYALNPACVGGPFAAVSAEAHAVWLSRVTEAKPLWALARLSPLAMMTFGATALAGCAAAVLNWRRERSADAFVLAVAMAGLTVLAVLMMKYIAYASLLAAVCIALALAALKDSVQMSAILKQTLGVFALNQVTVMIALTATAPLAKPAAQAHAIDACTTMKAVAPLAALPRGLIVAPIDAGPTLVAWTAHDVLAAPYHRIDRAIVTNEQIFAAEPATAVAQLVAIGASYVAVCGPTKPVASVPTADLLATLRSGVPVTGLLPVITPESASTPLRVWRVVR